VLLGPRRALRLAVAALGAGGVAMLAELAHRAAVGWVVAVALFFLAVGGWMLAWAARFDEAAVVANYRTAMRLAAVSSGGTALVIVALLR